jgi:anti-sigma regulatory factor (Ser/Thr protein kinase)
MVGPIELRLEARPEAVGRARRAVDVLADRLPATLLDDLRLMVSELVTNCLRHGRLGPEDPIDLFIDPSDDRVRIEVVNPGAGFRPPGSPPTLYQTSGWGLFLVSRLADRWGVEGRDGTRVWLEVGSGERRTRAG